jgi:hypothetical protein
VRLTVHDVTGARLATLLDGTRARGSHRIQWKAQGREGAGLPTGIYFLRLVTDSEVATRKCVLVR